MLVQSEILRMLCCVHVDICFDVGSFASNLKVVNRILHYLCGMVDYMPFQGGDTCLYYFTHAYQSVDLHEHKSWDRLS